MEVGPKCQGNGGECQGNVREWVQCASGLQGNAGKYQGNVWEWVQSARGRGMPGERNGVGAMCNGNAGE